MSATVTAVHPHAAAAPSAGAHERLGELMETIRRRCPRLPVLAASILNPRHPLLSDQLGFLDVMDRAASGSVAPMPSLLAMLLAWARTLVFALRETWRVIRVKRAVGGQVRSLLGLRPAVVVKTWCFGVESLKQDVDFYFGALPRVLQARGVLCILLCGDGRAGPPEQFAHAALAHPAIRYVPEKALVPWWAPLWTAWQQWRSGMALRRLSKTEDPQLTSALRQAAIACVSASTTGHALYYYIAREAVRAWRPGAFATLYEGQPWEQPVWAGARAADPVCRLVGYQHTIVMPHSLALRRPRAFGWAPAAPDVALCLGEGTRNMMAPGHHDLGTRLIAFGSFRRSQSDERRVAPEPPRRTVLVLPEGFLSEATILFNFAMAAAAALPDHRFILRCHPVLPFEQVRPHLRGRPEDHPNIEISAVSIDRDFARGSVALYRGSSTILYAILQGLKPIYLHANGAPEVDPLFELTGWRNACRTAAELAGLLRGYAQSSADDARVEWEPAAEYIGRYTQHVTQESVDALLEAVGLTGAAGRLQDGTR